MLPNGGKCCFLLYEFVEISLCCCVLSERRMCLVTIDAGVWRIHSMMMIDD